MATQAGGSVELGLALKRIRLGSGLSQRELAEKLEVDPTYISHLEKGRREPSLSFLRRFAAASRVPTVALLTTALWSELDPREREILRPLLASLTRLTLASGKHVPS